MTYQVVVLRRAEQELNAAADWIAEYSPDAAARWFNSFVDSLLSLEKNPNRCGLAPENVASSYELRQLIYRPRQGRSFHTEISGPKPKADLPKRQSRVARP